MLFRHTSRVVSLPYGVCARISGGKHRPHVRNMVKPDGFLSRHIKYLLGLLYRINVTIHARIAFGFAVPHPYSLKYVQYIAHTYNSAYVHRSTYVGLRTYLVSEKI